MAPGLSWANFGADGGDLIAAAATGGIAHPTGYPLYLLLARLFQYLPIGSLAFRTNLMSAIATAIAAVLIYFLVNRSPSNLNIHQDWVPGLAAGFAFGLSPLIWSQAVITEVYALQSLLVVILLFLSLNPLSLPVAQKRFDCLLGLTFGLAMGNHLTTIFMLPVIFSSTFVRAPTSLQGKHWLANWHLDGRSVLRRLGWLGGGLMIYLSLPLRTLSKAPINWGNPIDLTSFLWLVSGKLYQNQLFVLSFASMWERIQASATLLLGQFGVIGLSIGLIGLLVFFKSNRLNWSLLWISVVYAVFAIGYSTNDSFVYLIPAFLCFAVWIGLGSRELIQMLSKQNHLLARIIGLVFILTLFVQGGFHWKDVDASRDERAESFGENVLTLAPSNAIVFAKGDRAIFSLWYFVYALHERPDLVIVASDLLQFNWYLQTLRYTYPTLNLPDPFPFPETVVVVNPSLPVCYVQFVQLAVIDCQPARKNNLP